MEELIKKHLGINTPQWIIDNCKALLIEWDSLKGYTSERQLIIPDVSGEYCDCEHPTLGKSVTRCGNCDRWFKHI